MFRGINNDRRIYINIDDSMGLLKERRRLLDLDLRLLRRRERGTSCETLRGGCQSECQGERPRPIAGRRSWRETPMLTFATRGKLV